MSPSIAFLSLKNFILVFRKVANSEGSTSYALLFPADFCWLPDVGALEKFFLASINVSLAYLISNLTSFSKALCTHPSNSGFFPLSSPISIQLRVMIFMIWSSLRGTTHIIYIFCVSCCVFFSCILVISTRKSSITSIYLQY